MAKLLTHTPEMVTEYIKKGYWDEITTADYWNRNAKEYPDKEAAVEPFSGKRFTWKQLKGIIK